MGGHARDEDHLPSGRRALARGGVRGLLLRRGVEERRERAARQPAVGVLARGLVAAVVRLPQMVPLARVPALVGRLDERAAAELRPVMREVVRAAADEHEAHRLPRGRFDAERVQRAVELVPRERRILRCRRQAHVHQREPVVVASDERGRHGVGGRRVRLRPLRAARRPHVRRAIRKRVARSEEGRTPVGCSRHGALDEAHDGAEVLHAQAVARDDENTRAAQPIEQPMTTCRVQRRRRGVVPDAARPPPQVWMDRRRRSAAMGSARAVARLHVRELVGQEEFVHEWAAARTGQRRQHRRSASVTVGDGAAVQYRYTRGEL